MLGSQKPPSSSGLLRKETIFRIVCRWFFMGVLDPWVTLRY